MSLKLKFRPAKIFKLEIWPASTNSLPTPDLIIRENIDQSLFKLRSNIITNYYMHVFDHILKIKSDLNFMILVDDLFA